MRCSVPATNGFEYDGAQREQRGLGATCAHRPVDETKSNEDQKLCDGGNRSIHLVAPPRDIALDDADEKREQRGRGATCAHRPAYEIEPSEDQKLCDGGGHSNQLVAPPRAIALDDTSSLPWTTRTRSARGHVIFRSSGLV